MDGAMTMPAPKFVAVGPGSAIMKSMPNDATFLGHRFNEAFDAPFGGVVEAEVRVRHLATLRRNLHDLATSLLIQVSQCWTSTWVKISPMNRPTFNELAAFAAVAEHLSFRKAADTGILKKLVVRGEGLFSRIRL
jgi:hypothetical protein